MTRVLVVALAVLVTAPAWAKTDPVAVRVAAARKRIEAKELEKGVGELADAIVLAQRSGSLHEQEAVDLLDVTVEALPSEPATSAGGGAFGQRRALALVMSRLDPKRRSAFVSAPALAHALLLQATLHGDGGFLAESAAVLEAHAKAPKAGRAAAVLALYARGAVDVAAQRAPQAVGALSEALAATTKEGWTELRVFVAAELASALARAGDAVRAKETLAAAAKDLDPKSHAARELRRLAGGRLSGLPPGTIPASVVPETAWKDAGRGAGGPPEWVDPEGTAVLDRQPLSKPVVSVTRTPDGWRVRHGLARASESRHPLAQDVTYASEGGVVVAFHGEALGAYLLDVSGRRGGPGGGSTRPLARAFYVLGVGETYAMTKQGLVTIE